MEEKKTSLKENLKSAAIVCLLAPLVISFFLGFFAGPDVAYALPDWFNKWAILSMVIIVGVGLYQWAKEKLKRSDKDA